MFLQYIITKTLYVAEYNIILYRLLFLLEKPRKVCAMNDAYDQFSPHLRMCWSHLHCTFTKIFTTIYRTFYHDLPKFLPNFLPSIYDFYRRVLQALGFFRQGFCKHLDFFDVAFVTIRFFCPGVL